MKNKALFIISLAASLILAGYLFKNRKGGKKEVNYKTVQTKLHDLNVMIQSTGSVEPMNKVQIMPPVSGRMEKILIQEGQMVERGEVIGQMSSTNRAALLDVASSMKKKEVLKWKEVYRPTPIVAPVAGLIISKRVVPGQTVVQQTVLFEMSDKLVVRAQVDETDIGKIEKGMTVEFSLDAYPKQKFLGAVSLIGHQSQLVNSVNVYQVEIIPTKRPRAPASNLTLRSGMTANVEFILLQKGKTLGIPNWAVQGVENQTVELLDKLKKKRSIKLGRSDGQFVEVLEGASEGETFLIPTFSVQKAKKSFSPFARNKKKKGKKAWK